MTDKTPSSSPKTAAAKARDQQTKRWASHDFSGESCWIKLYKIDEHSVEPRLPFFGLNFYQITIQRDRWVEVPVEMADHIESLVYTAKEEDPQHPDKFPEKFIWVDRQRFPMLRSETKPAEVARAEAAAEAA